ncbi:unnamed protein product [Rotaria sordida]|uniref:Uncharacterized protein n=1 Tax=Rotaria sordida TaxID=392033 RepID=A0A818IAR7_9BILA|nr:unnamed protein product [Rotaria sordida]CAF3766005.1 unnamed protein product [Rotaria sordida]
MRTSLKNLRNNNNHLIKYNNNKELSSNISINIEENMSILTKNNKNYREKENNEDSDDEAEEEEDDDENSKLVSIKIEHNQEERQQQTSPTKLRSILRKRTEKKMSTETCSNVQQTSIIIDENANDDDEKDDYTGDENEQESNGSNKSIEEESKNNEQQHHRCRNISRHTQRNQFFRTSPSTSLIFPLDTTKIETRTTASSTTIEFHERDYSPTRTACVTFANDKPTLIHRSSSTPQLSGFDIQPRSSVTYINMREDMSTTIPITTTGPSASLSADFHPVYVSPLKYRPLVGLSANQSRLLLEKRVSLLGKPLVLHPIQRRSAKYRRIQLRIYNFLERPHGYKAVIYHTIVFLTVFLCLFLSVVVTMPEYESIASTVLLQTEIIVVIWLATEFALRVWSAGCRSRYQTLMGRLRFMKKPFCALDFTVIMATVVTLCLNSRGSNGVFAASALRGLRFFQILRMLRMDRRGGTWKLLGSVVYAHRQELITTIYIEFLVLIFSSFVMFLVEKDSINEIKETLINNTTNIMTTSSITNFIDTDRHKFETFADALWWGIITLCTVGYGDKVPSSYIGKLLAAICSFIGISFFALPAGILGSGFALKVQQQQRQKHYKRRKIPAVLLIQNLWRVYAADEKSLSKATWKVHVRPPRKEPNPSTTSQTNPNPVSFSSFRMRNNQFLNRVSFRRRTPARETPTIPLNNPTNRSNNQNIKPLPNSTVAAMRSCIDTLSETVSITPSVSMNNPQEGSSSDNEDDRQYYANDVQSLKSIHRHAIRFIRKVKYFVARRKFREALRPYDVTDVIEQYSTGNVDMLARMKYLQARLDKVLGISKSVDSYESGPSLASRICKIERQVDSLDIKVDRLCQLTNSLLECSVRQQASTPTTTGPTTINCIRNGNRFSGSRRQRRRIHPRTTIAASSQSPSQMPTSFRTNSMQPSVNLSLSARNPSHDSLVSLYWLFQDNMNSSRTHHV